MTWQAEYFSGPRPALAKLSNDNPYLLSLLYGAMCRPELYRLRTENFVTARQDEFQRPRTPRGYPYHLILDPSSACGLRCPLCVHGSGTEGRARTFLKMETARKLYSELGSYLLRSDLFSWGEPLMHPEIGELALLSQSWGIWARTSSHLSLERLDPVSLVRSGLNYLVVSIDGASQATYEIYRKRGKLDLVLENVARIIRTRDEMGAFFPILDWQYLVFSHNIDQIHQAKEMAKGLGFDVFRFGGAKASLGNRILMASRDNFDSSREILVDPTHPLSEYRESGEPANAEEQNGCKWLWGKMVVQADSGISPCWNVWDTGKDLANATYVESVKSLWIGDRYSLARQSAQGVLGGKNSGVGLEPCKTCALNKAYVNPPDPITEIPALSDLSYACDLFRDLKWPVEIEVMEHLREALSQLPGSRFE